MIYTDLQLVEIETEALFVHNKEGRLLRVNEPDPEGPAPRFFLGRTKEGNIWRTRFDLQPELAVALEALATKEPINPTLQDPPLYLADYVKLLEEYAPITEEFSGPSYYLPPLLMPDGVVLITGENVELLRDNYPYTADNLSIREPAIAIIEDGKAVTLCCTVRLTDVAGEAGLRTDPDYQGHGYGAKATQAWAFHMRAINRLPLYSTSWDNLASQGVARKLGAVLFANTLSLT